MQKNLDSYFVDFVLDRVDDIVLEVMNSNEEVEKIANDSMDLFSKIIKALPKEDKILMFRYEGNISKSDLHYHRIIYKQGFKDGVEAVKCIFNKFDYPNKIGEP